MFILLTWWMLKCFNLNQYEGFSNWVFLFFLPSGWRRWSAPMALCLQIAALPRAACKSSQIASVCLFLAVATHFRPLMSSSHWSSTLFTCQCPKIKRKWEILWWLCAGKSMGCGRIWWDNGTLMDWSDRRGVIGFRICDNNHLRLITESH